CAVPAEVFDLAVNTLQDIPPIIEKGNPNAISDVGVAISNLQSAVQSAKLNILINLKSIRDPDYVQRTTNKISEVLPKFEKTIHSLMQTIESKL
ncbi:MAG: cyclodeaminase/cyclohydrolase family protein, partial [candidate division WOR-3 bacterium]